MLERAHGDGMTIGNDSVEAFEEILWRAFWPEKYPKDRIELWAADDSDVNEEFELFMRNHLRKLIALRSGGRPGDSRYVSKNNTNVSRIPKITQLFPDAVILIPFRTQWITSAQCCVNITIFTRFIPRTPSLGVRGSWSL